MNWPIYCTTLSYRLFCDCRISSRTVCPARIARSVSMTSLPLYQTSVRVVAGQLRKIPPVQLLENVLELVGDPFTRLRPGRDRHVGHNQPGLIAAKCRACAIAGLAEPHVEMHADHQRSRLGDALVLLTKCRAIVEASGRLRIEALAQTESMWPPMRSGADGQDRCARIRCSRRE